MGLAAMWKWYYYAPNTYKQLKISQMRKEGKVVSEEDAHSAFVLPIALFSKEEGKKFGTGPIDFLKNCMGPYLLIRFFLMPAPLALINPAFYWAAVTNLALADVLSNIHSFIIIATNHCGNDMYKFANSCTPRSGTFYMRAVTSSANFRLLARLAQLPDRAPRLSPAVNALIPKGGAGDASNMREAQRAIRAAECLPPPEKDGGHHGGCNVHAPL